MANGTIPMSHATTNIVDFQTQVLAPAQLLLTNWWFNVQTEVVAPILAMYINGVNNATEMATWLSDSVTDFVAENFAEEYSVGLLVGGAYVSAFMLVCVLLLFALQLCDAGSGKCLKVGNLLDMSDDESEDASKSKGVQSLRKSVGGVASGFVQRMSGGLNEVRKSIVKKTRVYNRTAKWYKRYGKEVPESGSGDADGSGSSSVSSGKSSRKKDD